MISLGKYHDKDKANDKRDLEKERKERELEPGIIALWRKYESHAQLRMSPSSTLALTMSYIILKRSYHDSMMSISLTGVVI